MYAIVSTKKIQLIPGTVMRIPATWREYQSLCDSRGDSSIPRIKYRNGEALLMAPLAVHGRDVGLIASVVRTLLDHDDCDYDEFTPITMTIAEESGIEPDYCFYIQHWEAVSGKERIDWEQDPPPDLVIEIDVTSYSNVDDYLPYRVPEVWMFRKQKLMIYQLTGRAYVLQAESLYFPGLNLVEMVDRARKIAYDRNTSAAIRDLKKQLKDRL
jgi:Uma2 family endonuclease